VGVVVVFHDDTHQRSIRRNLEAVNARLRESQREIHHRVKNHLQIASSLIEIREGEEELVPVSSLRSLKLHIQSLARIHDLLTSKIDSEGAADYTSAKETLEKLIPLIRATVTDRVIRFTGEHVRLSIPQSTSLALIVNELALNAVKYGGEDIEITCKAAGGVVVLEVCDNGPGFPEGFDARVHGNTGLQVASAFATQDLKGSLDPELSPKPFDVAREMVRVGPARRPNRDGELDSQRSDPGRADPEDQLLLDTGHLLARYGGALKTL